MQARGLTILGVILTLVGLAAAYYFGGTSLQRGTRSYFLEQRLRHLLFRETHGPVDYRQVIAEYERLLPLVRFSRDTDTQSRYQRALARTKVSLELVSQLERYRTNTNRADLQRAHHLYRGVFTQSLNEYDFYLIYLGDTRIDEDWFRDESIKAGLY